MTIRILLADDHEIVRAGLASQLAPLGQLDIVQAWDLDTLMARARTPPPCDLAVVDVFMPGMEGGRQLAALQAACPELPLVILTAATALPYVAQWAQWPSVRAILHKSGPSGQLLRVVQLALAGAMAEVPVFALPQSSAATRVLSPRLLQVAECAAQGLSNRQIAAQLGLTEGSVKQYLKLVFHTLGVTNRTQLALLLRPPDMF